MYTNELICNGNKAQLCSLFQTECLMEGMQLTACLTCTRPQTGSQHRGNKMTKPAITVHTCNHNTKKAKARGLQVQGQPVLHSTKLLGQKSTEGILSSKSSESGQGGRSLRGCQTLRVLLPGGNSALSSKHQEIAWTCGKKDQHSSEELGTQHLKFVEYLSIKDNVEKVVPQMKMFATKPYKPEFSSGTYMVEEEN